MIFKRAGKPQHHESIAISDVEEPGIAAAKTATTIYTPDVNELLCHRCTDLLSRFREHRGSIQHHESIVDLETASTAQHCCICTMLLAVYPETELEILHQRKSLRLEMRLDGHSLLNVRQDEHFVLTCHAMDNDQQIGTGAQLYFSKYRRSSRYCTPPGRALSTGDPDILNLAKGWYTQCYASHNSCRSPEPVMYPDRILCISPDGPIRLVSTSRLQHHYPRYATLSHCWGGAQPFKLTSDTLDAFMVKIPEAHLPKTFMDAIATARYFNLQYLWIDSLCIVQDDPMDWQQESTKMADVYGCSALNISATAAENGTIGLFFQRDSRVTCKVTTTQISLRSEIGNITFDVNPADIIRSEVDLSPLASRGWYFQERFLSPRTLHFTRSQIYWECQEVRRCETFPGGVPSHFGPRSLRPRVDKTFAEVPFDERNATYYITKGPGSPDEFITGYELENVRLSKNYAGFKSLEDTASIWAQCVSIYSRTKLSHPSDKLVAISGVARWISRQSPDIGEYLAGLWSKHLEIQLLWCVVGPEEDAGGEESGNTFHLARPTEYLAPSWSWASTNKFVTYRTAYNLDHGPLPRKIWVRHVSIMGTKTQLRDETDPFGQVTGGVLCVSFTHIISHARLRHLRRSGRIAGDELRIDWDYGARERAGFYLLPIISCCNHFSNSCFLEGLVLKEIRIEGTSTPRFIRLGIFATFKCSRLRKPWVVKGDEFYRFWTRIGDTWRNCLEIQ